MLVPTIAVPYVLLWPIVKTNRLVSIHCCNEQGAKASTAHVAIYIILANDNNPHCVNENCSFRYQPDEVIHTKDMLLSFKTNIIIG